MRIVVAAGHFMPEVGYQEVYLARACSRLGHDVMVVSSDLVSPSSRDALGRRRYASGKSHDQRYGFAVVRLRPLLHVGGMVVAPGLRSAVDEFDPDVVLAIGVGKLFPAPLLTARRRYKLVVLFGDNADSGSRSRIRRLRTGLTQRLLKDRVYRRAVKFADRICTYTPETRAIVAASLSRPLDALLERKHVRSSLGYDPDDFFFSREDRVRSRSELTAAPDEFVFITCTRVTAAKDLGRIVDAVTKLRLEGHGVRYVLAGFLGDAYGSTLARYMDAQPHPEIFSRYPFLDHVRMRRLFAGADAGVWTQAAISIQEAMGTGLPLLLRARGSVSHLVQDGRNGWTYSTDDDMEAAMRNAIGGTGLPPREAIASENRARLSYDVIAENLIASVAGDDSAGVTQTPGAAR